MKRSWPTYFMIGGLAVLLVALGVLQYRWLSQASAADAEKERQRINEQAHHLAKDFDREIQNAYFIFQTSADNWRDRDWSEFNERYKLWKERSAYPDLVDAIYFLEARSDAEALQYLPDRGTFETTQSAIPLESLKARLAAEGPFKFVHEDEMILLLPVYEKDVEPGRRVLRVRSPEGAHAVEAARVGARFGCMAIQLNERVLKEQLLPDLTQKYFGDGEYTAAVVNSRREPIFNSIASEPDAAAPLFDLSPDNLMFMASRELISSIEGTSHDKVIVDSHVEAHSLKKVEKIDNTDGTTRIEIKRTSLPRSTSVYTATFREGPMPPWTLLVQHSKGSLDAYAAATLNRNFATGFGLLSLVALAIGAIIVSSLRAKALAQRQVDFVSSVSHEFRTPLAVIYSAGENLADGVARDDSHVSRYGNLIKGEGRKLSAMVEQILEFAGANSGRRKFNFAETSLDDVINTAIQECGPIIEGKGANIDVQVSDRVPPISADKTALSQALQNLIANAIKYSNGRAEVAIAAQNGNGRVRISVEDHGIGIGPADLKKIFEPFYRSKEVVDAQIHGNGLGLSLVRQIVEAHRGSVSVKSDLGRGSIFTIDLPAN